MYRCTPEMEYVKKRVRNNANLLDWHRELWYRTNPRKAEALGFSAGWRLEKEQKVWVSSVTGA